MRTIEVTMTDDTVEKFYPDGGNNPDYIVSDSGALGISQNGGDSYLCGYAPGAWKKVKGVDSK